MELSDRTRYTAELSSFSVNDPARPQAPVRGYVCASGRPVSWDRAVRRIPKISRLKHGKTLGDCRSLKKSHEMRVKYGVLLCGSHKALNFPAKDARGHLPSNFELEA